MCVQFYFKSDLFLNLQFYCKTFFVMTFQKIIRFNFTVVKNSEIRILSNLSKLTKETDLEN